MGKDVGAGSMKLLAGTENCTCVPCTKDRMRNKRTRIMVKLKSNIHWDWLDQNKKMPCQEELIRDQLRPLLTMRIKEVTCKDCISELIKLLAEKL